MKHVYKKVDKFELDELLSYPRICFGSCGILCFIFGLNDYEDGVLLLSYENGVGTVVGVDDWV